jgi:hypothetical protein
MSNTSEASSIILSAGDLHALQGFDAVVERGMGAEETREHSASLQRGNDAEG